MEIKTLEWKHNAVVIIDQTLLPGKLKYLHIKDVLALWQAIKELKVRGAPALGAAAAFGVYLGVKDSQTTDSRDFLRLVKKVSEYLGSSRPTAINLFWGLNRMRRAAQSCIDQSVVFIKERLFQEACAIIEEDRVACRNIGKFGATLIRDNDTLLTVCNAGILATIDYGTALGVMYRAKDEGRRFKVYACETRPLLQGARLTSWELKKKRIDVTLICDNMAASLMQQGKISKVIAGADRIAVNGDAANKIGTYSLAVLCHYHKVPFYIAAPLSSFDIKIKSGRQIPVEERSGLEITELFFKRPIAASGVKVYNPAFDVTPHELITAIITDAGIIRAPYALKIREKLTPRQARGE
ncbi:MAG: S-methyl-5-thioribose-1-phosphate isomerase [Candidatus Omnitrophota bacterium]|jgi:methylthioribose-1-phosphate isomerase